MDKSVAATLPDRDQMMLDRLEDSLSGAKEFWNVFCHLDKNRSDSITFEEFEAAMTNEYMTAYMAHRPRAS